MKKIQLNEWNSSSSRKVEDSNSENFFTKITVKKKNIFDKEILIPSNESAESSEMVEISVIEPEMIKYPESSFNFDMNKLLLDQSKKFITFLNNFEMKNPEKYKKTIHHISKVLGRISGEDLLNNPDKVRENKDKIPTNPDFLEHFNTEINLESSNSGISEMKSNLSNYYDSMKKNNFGSLDKNKEDHEIFVRYYNDGLKTIEETTENLISKTDLNTNTNFQSRSAMKSIFKMNLESDLEPKSLSLLRYISKKCEGGQTSLNFKEIVKGCDKSLKVQTFLELMNLNSCNKIQIEQEKEEAFGDIFVSVI